MTLELPATLYQQIVSHAKSELPCESVGMLLGREGKAWEYVPLVNELKSTTRFLTEARSMLAAEKRRRELKCEVLAMVHSHPSSAAIPSQYDRADHYSQDVLCMIVSLRQQPPELRAWNLQKETVTEAPWILVHS